MAKHKNDMFKDMREMVLLHLAKGQTQGKVQRAWRIFKI
jgi:hypothetical protein